MIEKKYWNYQSKQTFGKKFEQFSNLQFHSDHELRRKLNGRQWKLLRVWYALSHHSDFFLSPSFIGIQPSHKDRINFKCIYSPIYPYCQYLSSPPPPPPPPLSSFFLIFKGFLLHPLYPLPFSNTDWVMITFICLDSSLRTFSNSFSSSLTAFSHFTTLACTKRRNKNVAKDNN